MFGKIELKMNIIWLLYITNMYQIIKNIMLIKFSLKIKKEGEIAYNGI